MKTIFLTLAAVLGMAVATASLIPAAHTSNVHLFPAADVNG
jgi:hypothetical protein